MIEWIIFFFYHPFSLSLIPLFLSDWLLERHRQTCVGPEWKCSVQWQLSDGEPDSSRDNHHGNVPSDCFHFCIIWVLFEIWVKLSFSIDNQSFQFHNLISPKSSSHLIFQLKFISEMQIDANSNDTSGVGVRWLMPHVTWLKKTQAWSGTCTGKGREEGKLSFQGRGEAVLTGVKQHVQH